jgi:hypothetical protein
MGMETSKSTTAPSRCAVEWLPPRDDWDFRAIPPEKCRAACHWEYARSIEPPITDVVEYHKKYGDDTILGRLLCFEVDLTVAGLTHHKALCRSLSIDDLKNAASFAAQLEGGGNAFTSYVWRKLSSSTRKQLASGNGKIDLPPEAKANLVNDLNGLVCGECLYNKRRFAKIPLDGHTNYLISERPKGEDLLRVNRMILEEAFPLHITKNTTSPIPWSYYNVWNGLPVRVIPTPVVKQEIVRAVAGGLKLEAALRIYLNDLDYVLGADFYHHGVTTVVTRLESWARKEAKKFPRAKSSESYYDYLKWLAAYRLETARKKAKIPIGDVQDILQKEAKGRADSPDTLPLYASHGAWSKAIGQAAQLIKLFKTHPEKFERKILF